MTITINPVVSPRIVTVPEADGESITIQSLVNQIRDWEDDQVNLCYPSLLSASGKEVLDENTKVGITAQLLNAKVKFEDRGAPTICTIYGGNLVAVDALGISMSPIEPATNVSMVLAQSSSATMLQDADINAIKIKTDNLPTDPASEPLVQDIKDAIGTPTSTVSSNLDIIETEITGIKGIGWSDETLKKIKELITQIKVTGGASFKV